MDRNGYNPSLLDTEDGKCYLCNTYKETIRHEIFYGRGTRDKSKKYGMWVNLCPDCHRFIHATPNMPLDLSLQDVAIKKWLEQGRTMDDFRKIFIIGNVKHWEE